MVMDDEGASHVVVGVDGTKCSMEALEWAAEYADRVSSVLRIVTVWRYPVDYRFQKENQVTPSLDAERLNDEAVAWVKATFPSLPVVGETTMGWAPTALVDASDGADLLVVGQHTRTFSDVFSVSVSEFCTRHATCSTLVFHERPERDVKGQSATLDTSTAAA